jgi:hypothetical protein
MGVGAAYPLLARAALENTMLASGTTIVILYAGVVLWTAATLQVLRQTATHPKRDTRATTPA